MAAHLAKKIVNMDQPGAVIVNNTPVTWNQGNKGFSILGNDSIMMWVKPSLATVLQPLMDELGEDLYSRVIAFESSKGTHEDYHVIVTKMGKTFEEGFLNWGRVVSACGWGEFDIIKLDWKKKEALIRIDNPWELKLFNFKKLQNNIPFLNGKVSGIFSHAFGTNCRAEVVEISNTKEKDKFVILELKASLKTLEEALLEIHQQEQNTNQPHLRAENSSLRRDQRRFLDVIETVGDVIWESDRNLQITFATDKAWKILHFKDQNIVGQTWSSILGEGQNQKLLLLLNSLAGLKVFVEGEFEFTAENKSYWVLLRVKQLLDYNGNNLGYIGSASDITSRKELEFQVLQQQKEFQMAELESAHQAGMADVATGILHNVGNILNSVNISAETIAKVARGSLIENFALANKFLKDNEAKWGEFFLNDPKGKQLPHFYSQLEGALGSDFKNLEKESSDLLRKIQLIKEVISLQQNFASGTGFKEEAFLQDIVENALSMTMNSLSRDNVEVIKKFSKTEAVVVQKAKLLHVIFNLVKNAKEAMGESSRKKILTLEIGSDEMQQSFIRISDTGVGVSSENLSKIFSHGFTTKKEGHGFGLHFCANALTEMGGVISVSSEGEGKGTVFTIKFAKLS